MKRALMMILAMAGVLLAAACGSTRKLPEPSGTEGQVLVELLGKPKEGVGDAKTMESREDYSISRTSVEQGKAFERVDYGRTASGSPCRTPPALAGACRDSPCPCCWQKSRCGGRS